SAFAYVLQNSETLLLSFGQSQYFPNVGKFSSCGFPKENGGISREARVETCRRQVLELLSLFIKQMKERKTPARGVFTPSKPPAGRSRFEAQVSGLRPAPHHLLKKVDENFQQGCFEILLESLKSSKNRN
ncbi:MAG: hypothetical protein J6S71_04925, partial [Clostridia bacterium]|nr:hypothetical protein [Clostridia bacterium]